MPRASRNELTHREVFRNFYAYTTIANNTAQLKQRLTVANATMLPNPRLAAFRTLYSQYRLHKVTLHFMDAVSTDDNALIAYNQGGVNSQDLKTVDEIFSLEKSAYQWAKQVTPARLELARKFVRGPQAWYDLDEEAAGETIGYLWFCAVTNGILVAEDSTVIIDIDVEFRGAVDPSIAALRRPLRLDTDYMSTESKTVPPTPLTAQQLKERGFVYVAESSAARSL